MLMFGLFLFVLLVVVHEYGHFLVAKRNGVEVEEFGIGFPPKIFGKTLGKGIFRSYYTVNLLPIGGFVKLKGESSADKRKGSFGAAPLRSKAKILLAGVAVNAVFAWLLLSIVAAIRMPVLLPNQFTVPIDTHLTTGDLTVGLVSENSPASRAGVKPGDEIISLNDSSIASPEQLSEVAKNHAGEEVILVIKSGGNVKNLPMKLDPLDGDKPVIGIAGFQPEYRRSTWSAPIVGVGLSAQLTFETIKAIGSALFELGTGDTKEASKNLTGPVGIFAIFNSVNDVVQMLFLAGIISLSLAIMNALPIPALDGGRLALYLGYRLFKKPVNPKVEEVTHTVGFMLLILLAVLISIVDVNRFF